MDKLDKKIVSVIQQNARIPISEIAREAKKAPTVIFERLKKLERNGIIKGYNAIIDDKALNRNFVSFVFIKTQLKESDAVGEAIKNIPGVQDIYEVAGEYTYLVKIRTAGPQELSEMLSSKFGNIHGITSTVTTVALRVFKEDPTIPVDME